MSRDRWVSADGVGSIAEIGVLLIGPPGRSRFEDGHGFVQRVGAVVLEVRARRS